MSDLAETPLGSETTELPRKLGTIRIKKKTKKQKYRNPPPLRPPYRPRRIRNNLGMQFRTKKKKRIIQIWPKNIQRENDNDKNTTSLDSFESVIASIVPQIVSEQVSKMRIAEKEQYTLLEKKHKSMLLQSRQARKQLEGHYTKLLREIDDENRQLRVQMEETNASMQDLKKEAAFAVEAKASSIRKTDESQKKCSNYRVKLMSWKQN